MKSSSDGPSANVALKVVFCDADGPDVAGVASERVCLATEMRTTRERMQMSDIVFRFGVY